MLGAECRRQPRKNRYGGGDGGQTQRPFKAFAQAFDVLFQAFIVGDDLAGPFDDAFALGCEAHESRLADNEAHVEFAFEGLEPGGQCRLRDVAPVSGTGKVLLACQRDQVGHLTNEHTAPILSLAAPALSCEIALWLYCCASKILDSRPVSGS